MPSKSWLRPGRAGARHQAGGIVATAVAFSMATARRAARDFIQFPWMDELTPDRAFDGVRAMGFGAGTSTDILAVSFSPTDAIGHPGLERVIIARSRCDADAELWSARSHRPVPRP